MATSELPFALLRPKHVPPRLDNLQVVSRLKEDSPEYGRLCQLLASKEPIAVDVETNGLETFLPSVRVVGISFADSVGSLYVDVRSSPEVYNFILMELFLNQTPLLAHNVFFDGSILNRDLNLMLNQGKYPEWYNDWKWLNFTTCTLACYKHLASEGWMGQTWTLLSAEKDVLLWTDTNKDYLNRCLAEAGIWKRPPPKRLLEKLYEGKKS